MRQETQAKFKNLVSAIVKKHGTKAITRAEVLEVARSNKQKFCDGSFITRNPRFKVGRGKLKVSASGMKATIKAGVYEPNRRG